MEGRSQSVRELTSAIASGHSGAFARFYRDWFDRAFRMARQATGCDEHFCLDVVQDAMMRVIRNVAVVDGEGELEAWLRTVVVRCAYDRLRAERRRRIRERMPRGDRGDPAELSERLAWLEGELHRLDPKIYPLVILRYRLGWTLERIGRFLGLRPGAVDGRLRRAVHQLREKAMEPQDPQSGRTEIRELQAAQGPLHCSQSSGTLKGRQQRAVDPDE